MHILNYIDEKQLKYFSNKLECIGILTSSDEHKNGLFKHLIDQLSKSINHDDLEISRNIDLKIITNQDYKYESIYKFQNIFKSIDIIKIYIPPELDVYYEYINNQQNAPLLGFKSGPNYIFFETIKSLGIYNTTLLLECDIFLSTNWISKIYNYVINSNGFWISGSMYDGWNDCKIDHTLNTHINGGVGLYATGNKTFKNFIDFCYDTAPDFIKSNDVNLPYDYLIKLIIEKYYNEDISNRNIWQFIKRQYIHNNHIFNYSTVKDKQVDVSKIKILYNYSIVHKKPF